MILNFGRKRRGVGGGGGEEDLLGCTRAPSPTRTQGKKERGKETEFWLGRLMRGDGTEWKIKEEKRKESRGGKRERESLWKVLIPPPPSPSCSALLSFLPFLKGCARLAIKIPSGPVTGKLIPGKLRPGILRPGRLSPGRLSPPD